MSQNNLFYNRFERAKNPIIVLSIIGTLSILIKFYYFTPDLPLLFDSLAYFTYATDISILKQLPNNYTPSNNGWSIFLSLFFTMFQFDNALSYMQLQRVLTIVISTLTIIPIYFLCNKFFEKKYSLIGSAIFAFEPRIIQNSLLGITEPLFIILETISIVLFLDSRQKIIYLSFALAALATIVRSEGLFLFLAISIIFFVRFRKDHFVIPKYLLAILIFVLFLLPISLYKMQIHEGDDRMISRVIEGLEFSGQSGTSFILTGFENFFKFLGWDLIPIFVFFVPIGVYFIFKNLNYNKWTIITSTIFLSLPALYAYAVPAFDTRFLFFLYPMFCVISIFTIQKFIGRFKKQNLGLIFIIVGILFASNVFLDFKKIDYEHEKESFIISKKVLDSTKGINEYYHESGYIGSAEVIKKWPNIPVSDKFGNPAPEVLRVDPTGFDSLSDFIKFSKQSELTHLVIDGKENRPTFLNDVFYNENNYEFLEKEYDSLDFGLNYHVKIFKINYDKLKDFHD